jgi:hypothetical protein
MHGYMKRSLSWRWMRRRRSFNAPLPVGRDSSLFGGTKVPSVIDGSPNVISKEAAAEDFLEPRLVIEPRWVLRWSADGGVKSSAITPLPSSRLPRRELEYDTVGGVNIGMSSPIDVAFCVQFGVDCRQL